MASNKDHQWMQMCIAGAQIFSTCGKAQFMCIIVDEHGRIVGTGYNGVPSGMTHCVDGGCPRFINNVPSGTPYDEGPGLCYSGHAEINALSHGDGTRYDGATLYVNGMCCLTCAKSIACAGIMRIVSLSESSLRLGSSITTDFLAAAGVTLETITA